MNPLRSGRTGPPCHPRPRLPPATSPGSNTTLLPAAHDGYCAPPPGTEAIANGTTVNTSAYPPAPERHASNQDRARNGSGSQHAPALGPRAPRPPRIEVQAECRTSWTTWLLGRTPDATPTRADAPCPSTPERRPRPRPPAWGGATRSTVKQAFDVLDALPAPWITGASCCACRGPHGPAVGSGNPGERRSADLDSYYAPNQDLVNLLARIGGIYRELRVTGDGPRGTTRMDPLAALARIPTTCQQPTTSWDPSPWRVFAARTPHDGKAEAVPGPSWSETARWWTAEDTWSFPRQKPGT
jgi:hypothetical protein